MTRSRWSTLGCLAVAASMLMGVTARAGYWKQQGPIVYPNKTMAPHVGGAATGPDHNGTCIGNVSAGTYSETRDMGKRSAWSVVVHEMTKWQASVGIPNVLVPGQVVPISGKLQLLANTWRGTSSWVMDLWLTAYLSRHGASEFPGTSGRVVTLFNTHIEAGGPDGLPKTRTNNVANTAARAPDNDGSGKLYLVWRAAWGVSAGTKNGDIFEVRVPYVWVDGKPPVTGGPVPTDNPGKGRLPQQPPPVPKDPPGSVQLTPKSASKLMAKEMGTKEAMKVHQVFFNGNDGAVGNGGRPARFTLGAANLLTFLMTYHYNGGKGAPAGTIGLRYEDGKLYGPWKATLVDGVYWVVGLDVILPFGKYEVIDSDPATWSQNKGSRGFGHTMIKGRTRGGI